MSAGARLKGVRLRALDKGTSGRAIATASTLGVLERVPRTTTTLGLAATLAVTARLSLPVSPAVVIASASTLSRDAILARRKTKTDPRVVDRFDPRREVAKMPPILDVAFLDHVPRMDLFGKDGVVALQISQFIENQATKRVS